MYRVIKFFTDLQDGKHPYNIGDEFPRSGKKVTKKRLQELSSDNNRQGIPLIEEVVKKETETAKESVEKTEKE